MRNHNRIRGLIVNPGLRSIAVGEYGVISQCAVGIGHGHVFEGDVIAAIPEPACREAGACTGIGNRCSEACAEIGIDAAETRRVGVGGLEEEAGTAQNTSAV